MGLDMLLVDARPRAAAPAGPAGRHHAAVRLGAGPPARHGGAAGRRAGPRAAAGSPPAARSWSRAARTSGSPTRPGPATRCCTGPCRRTSASARTAWELIEDADLDWQDDERIRFTADQPRRRAGAEQRAGAQPAAVEGGHRHRRRAAPSPGSGGWSATWPRRRGCPRWSSRTRSPSGEDLAVTPGAVVFRTDVFELIQYRPTTETVRAVPLLMVPPTINKFYIADLAPGRSIVEHYLAAGQQVFMMSWRNPDERHADWGLDTYGQAVLDAMDAVEQVTGSEQVALQAFCSGGIITSMVLAHLAATGPAGPGGRGQLRRHRPGLGAGRHRLGADGRGGGEGRDREVAEEGLPRRRRSWPRSSPGCGPTTWCGTTGSTTTCRASRRRTSTSSTGTPTPPG